MEVYAEEADTKQRNKKQERELFCVEYGDHYFDSHENVGWIQCIDCELRSYGRVLNTGLFTLCAEGFALLNNDSD
jgi:hypothetical protein